MLRHHDDGTAPAAVLRPLELHWQYPLKLPVTTTEQLRHPQTSRQLGDASASHSERKTTTAIATARRRSPHESVKPMVMAQRRRRKLRLRHHHTASGHLTGSGRKVAHTVRAATDAAAVHALAAERRPRFDPFPRQSKLKLSACPRATSPQRARSKLKIRLATAQQCSSSGTTSHASSTS